MGRRSTKSSPATGAALPFDTVGVTILPGVSLPEWAEPPAEPLMASGPELIADAGPMSPDMAVEAAPEAPTAPERAAASAPPQVPAQGAAPAPQHAPEPAFAMAGAAMVGAGAVGTVEAPTAYGSPPPRMARHPLGTVRRQPGMVRRLRLPPQRLRRTCPNPRATRLRRRQGWSHPRLLASSARCSPPRTSLRRRPGSLPTPRCRRPARPSTQCLPAPPTWLLTVHRPQQPATDRRSRQAAIPLRTPAWHPHRLDPARRRPRTPRHRRRWTRSPSHRVRPSAPRSVSR